MNKQYLNPKELGAAPKFYTHAVTASGDGKLVLGPNAKPLKLGEKVRLIPGHCDPTVNLHDWYVGVRHDRVEALWPISARGASI